MGFYGILFTFNMGMGILIMDSKGNQLDQPTKKMVAPTNVGQRIATSLLAQCIRLYLGCGSEKHEDINGGLASLTSDDKAHWRPCLMDSFLNFYPNPTLLGSNL